MARELIRISIRDAISVHEKLLEESTIDSVEDVTAEIIRSLRGGGKVLLCGNGGSASQAQHLAGELIGRFFLDRRALPAIALADNLAATTAIGNDYSYDDVFRRGVEGLGRQGDVLIGFSTSGSSANVVAAFGAAAESGLTRVALVGQPQCAIAELADHVISVRGPNAARIQEGHLLIGHTIFELVEAALCGQD